MEQLKVQKGAVVCLTSEGKEESVKIQLCDAHQTEAQMRNSNNTLLLAVVQLIVFGRREHCHDVRSYQQMFKLGDD